MSYLTGALLTEDVNFGRRSRTCLNQQANVYLADQRLDFVSLAREIILQNPAMTQTMLFGICAGAQFDVMVDNGDGTIDSTKIADADIQSRTDYIWPEVASFYFNADGTPKPNP
jgi:hypothetical protein